MATTRIAGYAASVELVVDGGDAVKHDDTRQQLTPAFPMGVTQRVNADGTVVDVAHGIRGGQIAWAITRSDERDKQLCGAHQKSGTLTVFPEGRGTGKPKWSLPVVVQCTLTVVAASLSAWQVTCLKAGAVTVSADT